MRAVELSRQYLLALIDAVDWFLSEISAD